MKCSTEGCENITPWGTCQDCARAQTWTTEPTQDVNPVDLDPSLT